jgi:hypothetical protein
MSNPATATTTTEVKSTTSLSPSLPSTYRAIQIIAPGQMKVLIRYPLAFAYHTFWSGVLMNDMNMK